MANILIVDDSKFQRMIISNLIKKLGHNVTEASSGQEALDVLSDNKFDCITLDLLMPDISGIEVLETIKSNNLNINVIVCSANVQGIIKSQCYELGAKKFLTKPIDIDQLKETIDSIINE